MFFLFFLKKCVDHDNTVVKNVALIDLNNPMSCEGKNFIQTDFSQIVPDMYII